MEFVESSSKQVLLHADENLINNELAMVRTGLTNLVTGPLLLTTCVTIVGRLSRDFGVKELVYVSFARQRACIGALER